MRLLILTALICLGSCYDMSDCPQLLARGEFLKVFGNFCYRFFWKSPRDFATARSACQYYDGELAMPKTAEINNWIAMHWRETFSITNDSWIGLTDVESEDVYRWADGNLVSWNNFADPKEGANEDGSVDDVEDCVTLRPSDGTWHDYHCKSDTSKRPFVCQYKPYRYRIKTTTPKPTNCPEIECKLVCGKNGYKYDGEGCATCACN